MSQRKKDKSLLQGHHSAERTGEIQAIYPDAETLTAPEYLHPYAKEVFESLFPILTKNGSLKSTDFSMFMTFCVEAGCVKEASEQLQNGLFYTDTAGKVHINPAEKMFRLHSATLTKLAVEIGLSPKARQAVVISQNDQIQSNDKLSKLLGDE